MKSFIRSNAALLAAAVLLASAAPAREIPAGAGASAGVMNAPAPREPHSKKSSHVSEKASSGSSSKKKPARTSSKKHSGGTKSKKSKQGGHTKKANPA
jgi:hypothetical protein